VAEEPYKALQDDVILPNVHKGSVEVGWLPNGDWLLFFSEELEGYQVRRPVSTDYWQGLDTGLRQAGFNLIVLLVPNKYTVYGDMVDNSRIFVTPPGSFLEAMHGSLKNIGITAINATEALRREARARITSQQYVYYRDDTHWNAEGTAAAAAEVARVLCTRNSECADKACSERFLGHGFLDTR
jgi:hypothetical protein